MAVNMENIDLPKVDMYYSECNAPLYDMLEHIKTRPINMHTINK